MPRRSSKDSDLNQLAASIVDAATNNEQSNKPNKSEESDSGKDPAAVELGRKGGLKGGKARAAKLTAKQRSDIARKAATARWGKSPKSG